MKSNILFVLLLSSIAVIGQGFPNVKVKEFYDANLEIVMPSSTMESLNVEQENGDAIGDGYSKYISSLTKMYESTGDKGYLVKFVKNSFIVQNMRKDHRSSPGDPVWSDLQGDHMYHDGYILKALAEFVYMVRNNSNLFNTALPTAASLGISSQYYPSSSLITPYGFGYTYGGYAKWLGDQVGLTLDWFSNNGYWDATRGMINPADNRTIAINMQAGFAVAFYYMGACDPNTYYQAKANSLANFYMASVIDMEDNCNCIDYGPFPVFRLMANNNNSYFWFDDGWAVPTDNCALSSCPPYFDVHTQDVPDYLEFPEDASHAVPDLWVPLAYMRFSPTSGYFDTDDMIRWRNTFTKNIYDNGNFHNNCIGTETCYTNGCGGSINDLKYAAFSYMPFYQWDGADWTATEPNTYDIVMDLFVSDIESNGNDLPAGFNHPYFSGIADVVTAQWYLDCVNLTLYNRKVNYAQDFIAKNKLIVSPEASDDFHQTNGNSFAEPIIPYNQFMIESGAVVNLVAGEAVELHAGFEAKLGSEFSASVSSSSCTDGVRLAYGNNNDSESAKVKTVTSNNQENIQGGSNEMKSLVKAPEIAEYLLSIVPNPLNDFATVSFSVRGGGLTSCRIIDHLGREVFSNVNNFPASQDYYSFQFDARSLSKGVYSCILEVNGQVVKSKKIVLMK